MRRPHRFDEWQQPSSSSMSPTNAFRSYDHRPDLMVVSPDHHEPHEHGSDPDETDDESVFPRVRSFGDAEDYLNKGCSTNHTNHSIHNNDVVRYYHHHQQNHQQNHQQYHHQRNQAFLLQSPAPTPPLSQDGNGTGNHTQLHHRSRHLASTPMNGTINSSLLDEDESPRHRLLRQFPSLSSASHHYRQSKRSWYPSSPTSTPLRHHGQSSIQSSLSLWKGPYALVRWCFMLCLGSYLVLLSKSTYYLGQHQDLQPPYSSSDADMPWKMQSNSPQRLNQRQQQQQQQQQPSHSFYFTSSRYFGGGGGGGKDYNAAKWFQQREIQIADSIQQHEQRAFNRRQNTQRPTMDQEYYSSSSSHLKWHSIAPLNDARPYQSIQDQIQRDNLSEMDDTNIDIPATVDQLCGFHAQNASLVHPHFYSSRTALNSNARVLITGILNPVGFSLALYLKEKCGVEQIAGVDAMYPNTVYNRLLMQERIKILTTNIPKLVKPIFLSFVGLDPSTKSSTSSSTGGTDLSGVTEEMNWVEGFEPTHIVHLASYSLDAMYNDALIDPEWKNTRSPYVLEEDKKGDGVEITDPFLYPMRFSMASMEQLLQSIVSVSGKERPQFIYAKQAAVSPSVIPMSQDQASNPGSGPNTLRASMIETLGQIDSLLVDAFHAHFDMQLPSIGLKFPNGIYGPWGQAGSIFYDIFEKAAESHQLQQAKASASTAGTIRSFLPENVSPASWMNMLFVDDAVEALVSAMQYQAVQPLMLSVPPQESSSIATVVSTVQSFLVDQSDTTSSGNNKNPFLDRLLANHDTSSVVTTDSYAHSMILPSPQTPLKDGLLRSLAWHVDKISPFGSAGVETGDALLRRHDMETCSPDDVTCHKSFSFLPCNSECNIHEKCLPSIFDSVRDLVRNVSDGCDIVLYTQSLGYNVKEMDLHAEYMDDKDLDDDELLVCNFAFVPRESKLVAAVSDKVPSDQLSKFGIKPVASDGSSKAMTERKLDGLNGRLLYRGWILIWIPGGTKPLSPMDQSFLKISPSKLFHPGVRHGVFVEENFSVSPNLEDVLFLVDELKRRSLPDRTVKKEEKIKTPNGVISKKSKYRIPKEPSRRAAILFTPLRYPNSDDPITKQYRDGNRKLSIYDAAKFMRFEVGYELGEKEPASLRRQREYYERVPSYINKNTELRSNFEPWYRFMMRHWVRTRWVVHDFGMEESRQLRCDWYREHVQWGNDLDQLSFANVMATRELKRRVAHREPDDHVKSFIEEHPELHDLTDSYEWHALETDMNKLHGEPSYWKSRRPDHAQVAIDSVGKVHEVNREEEEEDKETPLYVRIMSERVMAVSRKIWTKTRRQILKAKAHHK
ncbi:hypothetical protein IV203_004482 [Nitzschia inconspicua]|uniref:Uncharacterized protein n=1 Tax=Nitzschia inconspicua TaxID=303405 RepID=A0A9K3L5E8_9STRA|nr:hypothetical protein IV203_004482 [Nitzschia inconspicua]